MLGSRSLTIQPCKPLPSRLLLLLTLSVALVAGCGGGAAPEPASSSTDVNQLLRDTFQNLDKITSANISAKLAIQGQGQAQQIGATLSGPFQSQGAGKLPKFQLDATLDSGGQSFTAGATWTGDKGFVNVQGTQYAVSGVIARQFAAGYEQAAKSGSKQAPGALGALGIDFSKWLKNGRNAGEAQVGDAATIKVTGEADVGRVVDDLQHVADKARTLNLPGATQVPRKITPQQRDEIVAAIKNLAVEVYTGKDDRILRRVVVGADVQDPASKSTSHVAFDLTLDKVGSDQVISAPKSAKPFSELVKVADELTGGLGGLGALGSSGSSGGAGSGSAPSSQANIEKYAACIEQANGDSAKAQKCADLLGS
jgi:hypothetical protein